jgi:nucleotide-binding universal stress UspA family protein
MKRILVPTDGSSFAKAAFAKACEIAGLYEGSIITILAVAPLPMLELLTQRPPFLGEEVLTVEINKQMERQAQFWIDSTLESQPSPSGSVGAAKIPIDTKSVMGHPGEVICEVAADGKYDLVVLGHHGSGKLHRLILGSVSDFVVHHSPCSVFIVKAGPA